MRLSMRQLTAVALGLVLGASACNDDELLSSGNAGVVDPMFERYVSLGNSITAGFQSGGINEVTQNQSYAVLLAGAMGTTFYAPLMNQPGCPSLYTNVFTQTRVPGPPCALRRIDSLPQPYVNNVAVPGARVIDIYNNLDPASNANALTTFFLGGMTQTQMMQRVAPTFVSVWIGNNDVLGAVLDDANAGDTTKITPVATFQARYGAMLDSIDAAGPTGGVVIGVADVTVAPYTSAGAVYWAIKNGQVPGAALPPTFIVDNNCAPGTVIPGSRGDSVLVPFPYGGTLLAIASGGGVVALSCSDTIPQILVPAELAQLIGATLQYNAFIAAQAGARGWPYVDPNPILDSLRTAGEILPFPLFGQDCSANPFGTAFSCDGVHPSASTHRLIANKLRERVNDTYGTTIPAIP